MKWLLLAFIGVLFFPFYLYVLSRVWEGGKLSAYNQIAKKEFANGKEKEERE
jgi:hypothetical protein